MRKGKELYSGKAKSVFLTPDPAQLIMEFRDDTSAFESVLKSAIRITILNVMNFI